MFGRVSGSGYAAGVAGEEGRLAGAGAVVVQLASGPPIVGETVRLARLLALIVTVKVLPFVSSTSDAPMRSRFELAGVRVVLAE